jgi:glycosyltransferase involved in cell wall biosynthesis
MKTLIVENRFNGHYYLYLNYILPHLAELVGTVDVAITAEGRMSTEFQTYLAPLEDRVAFHSVLPSARPTERLRLHLNLREAVRRFRPEYVLVPSGDAETSPMGLFRIVGLGGLPGRPPAEVGIHYGYGSRETSRKDQAKDLLYLVTQHLSSWKKIHFANLLFYERARAWGGSLALRAELMPAPVPANPRLGKAESRQRLGIPDDGRYIGIAAILDRRKAIDTLLAAFRIAARPSDRLVLAGRLDPGFAKLVDCQYADLVRSEQLILFNRFLDPSTFQTILSALDVVTTPFPWHWNRSLTLLHGIAAGRPVLSSNVGWMRTMVERFGFGWTCDVLDPTVLAVALRNALDSAGDYCESEAVRRLLQFYSPENLVVHWLAGIRETMALPPSDHSCTWPSVLRALEDYGPATF